MQREKLAHTPTVQRQPSRWVLQPVMWCLRGEMVVMTVALLFVQPI